MFLIEFYCVYINIVHGLSFWISAAQGNQKQAIFWGGGIFSLRWTEQ